MSFGMTLTPAQQDLVERTHRFAEEVIRPVADHYDREEEFPWPVLEEAAQEGFYNPLFYRDLIGDPTGLSLPLFMEELFWGCAGIGLAIVMPALALSAMAQAATPEQLLRWAPECFGEPGDLKLAALCVSEPEGGSDVRNLRTARAPRRRRVGHRRPQDLDRQRRHRRTCTWSTRPSIPSSATAGRRCSSCPAARPAWSWCASSRSSAAVPRTPPSCGSRTAAIPAENLLGGDAKLERRLQKAPRRGNGRSSTLGAFEQTRPMVAAQALGIARAALEFACDYASKREAFGEPILEKQGISFPLADLAAELDAARLLTWRAAWMAAQELPYHHAEGSMSKLKASEVAVRTTEQAVQVCGG